MNWIETIQEEIRSTKLGRREVRNFGITLGILFLAWAGLAGWKGHTRPASWAGVIGALLLIFGLCTPRLLYPLYKTWMAIAAVIGWVMTRVILLLLFFLVLTPYACILRICGKRFLDLSWKKSQPTSYWHKRTAPADNHAHYEQQF